MEVRLLDYTSKKKRIMAVLRLDEAGAVVTQGKVPKSIEEA